MKKRILGFLLVVFVFVVGISHVNALTKEDEEKIANKVVDIHWYFDYFDEGELPPIREIGWFAITYGGTEFDDVNGYIDNYADYIINDGTNDSYDLYRVPAEIIEAVVLDTFEVDDDFFEEFRREFKNVDLNDTDTFKYVEYDGKYYYEFSLFHGLGGSNDIGGYFNVDELGEDYYQVNYYFAVAEDATEYEGLFQIPEDPVEGVDYVMSCAFWQDSCDVKSKYFIVQEFVSKVHVVDGKIKLLSHELVEDKFISKEESVFLEGENQKYDASKDGKLIFRIDIDFELFDKVYINGKEVDPKYYAVTEGSTVITFTDEYTKTLKNGKYDLEVTFTDGSVAETTFTVETSVSNTQTGLYTSLGIIAALGILGSSIVFISTRKHSKFPQA